MTPRHLRFLVLPAVLLALGVTAGLMRTVEGGQGSSPPSRGVSEGHPGAHIGSLAVASPRADSESTTTVSAAAGSERFATVGAVRSWPKHRKSAPGEPCASCDTPLSAEARGQTVVNHRGLLPSDRPSGPQAAAEQPNGLPPDVPASLKTSGERGVVIRDAVDMGFAYEPKAWQDGLLEIDNRSGKDVFVSFHGQGASRCQIDGLQVEEGRQYVVRGAAQIRGSSDVGVHVRTRGEGVETAPNGDG